MINLNPAQPEKNPHTPRPDRCQAQERGDGLFYWDPRYVEADGVFGRGGLPGSLRKSRIRRDMFLSRMLPPLPIYPRYIVELGGDGKLSRESKTPKQFGPGVVKAKLVICIIMERMIHTLDIENIYNQIATLADEHAPLNVLVDLSGVQKVSS